MKRPATLLMALAYILLAQSAPIDQQKARQQAEQFMQGKGMQLLGGSMRAPGFSNSTATQQPIYIFNAAQEKGFVVVAGDDCADAILGYAEEGHYDETQMPDNFREWLNAMAKEVEEASLADEYEKRTAKSSRRMPSHNAISPLIKTKWDQGKPTESGYIYNTLCPTIDGKHAYVGCTATAGAQVMYYYQHPKDKTKAVSGYTNTLEATTNGLPAITFNWDKMKTHYGNSDVGTESEEAVSQLMVYCGYASKMNYGVNGSGAYITDLAKGMVEFFGYDPNTYKNVYRRDFSVVGWNELIYNELANRRPIIFCGYGSGGHTFICDGYDGNGYYHFNWGDGGDNDGYYKLQATNPYERYESLYVGFCMIQSAIIGLQPNTGQYSDDIVGTASNVEVNGTTASMRLGNNNAQDCSFGFGIGELATDGSIKVIGTEYENYQSMSLQQNNYVNCSFDFSTYDLSEGKHYLVPISLLKGETTWKRCRPTDFYFEVTVSSSGTMTIITYPLSTSPTVKVTSFSIEGSRIATTVQKVVATVKSTRNEFKSPLYLFASTTSTKGKYVYVNGTAIEKDATEDVTLYFKPDKAGEWKLWVCTDSKGDKVIGSTTVTISSAPTGTVTLQLEDGEYVNHNAYKVTVKNTGTVDFCRYLYSKITDATNNTTRYDNSGDIYIKAGTIGEVSIKTDFLEPGHNYNVQIYYPPTISSSSVRNLGQFTFTVPTEGLSGDANGDGEVSVNDVQIVVEYVLGNNPTGIVLENCDVTGDGEISVNDVSAIAAMVLNGAANIHRARW